MCAGNKMVIAALEGSGEIHKIHLIVLKLYQIMATKPM